MDLAKTLKVAIGTGKVKFGIKETENYIKKKEVKLIIMSNTCPQKDKFINAKVPIYRYDGTARELGTLCGKPFSVSVLAVINPGNSGILALGE